ncbi:adenylate/guanylate cyclase domain-containing protein [Aestuariirhabdus litorea]|uniref:Guanylate cyclase domain-containing protein n=1 Tax=Aestuariirhabdus litorea TaxID=2528527 RepID=A0A3P3VPW1_9GAMM|nr:adenylate/guanylate cyclase domain-containing protein [Aestuariirhabdus litorea]RRJ82853.1 hypothetical protein D0544_13470 [Aestuariirhabdus litorea]RWW93013.1 adenylate/guanylate cyclase domain-containing protein [Endozoicomonadaceae bacterium GTF-13]
MADPSHSRSRCWDCDTPLPRSCSACGQLCVIGQTFCGSCGHKLTGLEARDREALAERRQLTVMFCDLVGSTALSQRLDPEDLRELIHAYQQLCRERVTQFGGYIARYMGDGVLVYFGYPRAHELDVERAVRAGLAIAESVGRIVVGEHPPLSVRVGIETGLVVAGDIIGEGESQEHSVLGDTPNLAARLQALARPGSVVVGPGTYRLISRRFRLQALGEHSLKGMSLPVPAYRVEGALEHARSDPSVPVLGRQPEIDLLAGRLLESGQQGAVLLLEGESGLGKSRLVRHLVGLASGRFERAVLHCSPFYSNRPLYPVRRHWNNLLGMQGTADRSRALRQLCEAHGVRNPELLEWLERALLIGDTTASDGASETLVGFRDVRRVQQERNEMLSALQEVVLRFSHHKPLLLVVEDAHWVDSSTAEFLRRLCQRPERVGLAILVTSREPLDWMPEVEGRFLRVGLQPLDPLSAQALVAAVAGGRTLPPLTCETIVQRSGGSPLYVEELTKAVLDASQQGEGAQRVPSSLEDSLRARLDRLGPSKAIAQFLAVLGRHFSHRLVMACAPFGRAECERGLGQLLEAGLLMGTGRGERRGYAFRHSMVQEVAYASLLNRTRRGHHRRIAERILQRLPELASSAPDMLASHFDQGQRYTEAIEYWYQAGLQAAASWAHVEAVNHFNLALKRLEAQGDPSPLAERELAIRIELVRSLRVLERVDEGLEQLPPAMRVARQLGGGEAMAMLQNLQGNLQFSRGDIEACLLSHGQALETARSIGSVAAQVQALSGIGDANLLRGMLVTAEQAYDRCLALCSGEALRPLRSPNLCLRGHMRLYLNRLPESEEDIREAIGLALELQDKRTEMIARGSCLAKTLCEQARYESACQELESALEVACGLKAERFEALYRLFLVRARYGAGVAGDLNPLADQAIEIAEATGFGYVGAIVFGAKALVAPDREACQRALRSGETLLTSTAPSQNHLWFLRDAIEVSLRDAQWRQAQYYAARLEQYTRRQPLAWATLYIDLVALCLSARSAARPEGVEKQVQGFRRRCGDGGMQAALQLLERIEGRSP